jgi:hypothetical protein
MKYLNFVGGDGLPAREDIAIMQREIPRWGEEMRARGVYHLGRSLDLPETAATVRVRDGETLVTDGPFTEAKEFIAGFDIIDVADLDEARQAPGGVVHELRDPAGGGRALAG